MEILLNSIGQVRSSRKDVRDDSWDNEESYVELSDEFTSESLSGLEDFSHIEIVYYMDKVDPDRIERSARHPRNCKNWPKVGIFAQRGKNRPNQIGLTVCRIKKIEGSRLFLEGLDAIDGTPVLDIKPWMKDYGPRGEQRQPEWVAELMRNYWS